MALEVDDLGPVGGALAGQDLPLDAARMVPDDDGPMKSSVSDLRSGG
jgi:hypothetical protein